MSLSIGTKDINISMQNSHCSRKSFGDFRLNDIELVQGRIFGDRMRMCSISSGARNVWGWVLVSHKSMGSIKANKFWHEAVGDGLGHMYTDGGRQHF